MSILIKGMAIPKNCDECPLIAEADDYDVCFINEEFIPWRWVDEHSCEQIHDRPSWCPLTEIPPHGRLIDADAMEKEVCGGCKHGEHKYENCIDCALANAPTIIEANDSGKQGKWVLKTFCDEYGEYQLYECNLCGAVTAQRKSKNYCHNCGAKMESEGDDG